MKFKSSRALKMAFKCPLCVYTIESIALLHVHCVSAHPKEFYTCPWCTVPYETLRVLQKHVPKCTALRKNGPCEGDINTVFINNNQCLVCGGRFDSTQMAIKHYKEQHLNFSYICDICEMYFQRNTSLDRHYVETHTKQQQQQRQEQMQSQQQPKKVSKRSRVSLPISISFATPIANSTRLSVSSSVKPVNPMDESLLVAKTTNPAFNVNVYHLVRSFNAKECGECDIKFTGKMQEVIEHAKLKHSLDLHLCDACDHLYYSRSSLLKHQKKYSHKNKNVTDKGADKENAKPTGKRSATIAFDKKANESPLTKKKTKVDAVPVPLRNKSTSMKFFNQRRCIDCNLGFLTMEMVREHFVAMHSVKVVMCKECDRGFLTESSFKYHSCPKQKKSSSVAVTDHPKQMNDSQIQFRCNFCPFTAHSDEAIQLHVTATHNQPLPLVEVKVEGDDADVNNVTTVFEQSIHIKPELNATILNSDLIANERPIIIIADFVDLTTDD